MGVAATGWRLAKHRLLLRRVLEHAAGNRGDAALTRTRQRGQLAAALLAGLARHRWVRIHHNRGFHGGFAFDQARELIAGGGGRDPHPTQLSGADLGVRLGANTLQLRVLLRLQQALRMALPQVAQAAVGLGRLDDRPEEAPERRRDGHQDHRDTDVGVLQDGPDAVGPLVGVEGLEAGAAERQAIPGRDRGRDDDSQSAKHRLDAVPQAPVVGRQHREQVRHADHANRHEGPQCHLADLDHHIGVGGDGHAVRIDKVIEDRIRDVEHDRKDEVHFFTSQLGSGSALSGATDSARFADETATLPPVACEGEEIVSTRAIPDILLAPGPRGGTPAQSSRWASAYTWLRGSL